MVCLDSEPQNLSDRDRSHKDMFRQMLTGGGVHLNGTNRWSDKTINVVCCLDGVNGICYEHTTAEGVAVSLTDKVPLCWDFYLDTESTLRNGTLIKINNLGWR